MYSDHFQEFCDVFRPFSGVLLCISTIFRSFVMYSDHFQEFCDVFRPFSGVLLCIPTIFRSFVMCSDHFQEFCEACNSTVHIRKDITWIK